MNNNVSDVIHRLFKKYEIPLRVTVIPSNRSKYVVEIDYVSWRLNEDIVTKWSKQANIKFQRKSGENSVLLEFESDEDLTAFVLAHRQ